MLETIEYVYILMQYHVNVTTAVNFNIWVSEIYFIILYYITKKL